MLKDETTCVVWIYPTYEEGPGWRMAYRVRDFLLFNQGHRLPPKLLRLLAYLMVIAAYPMVDRKFTKNFRRMSKDLPFIDVDAMTRRQRFAAQVFCTFDTCLPRYQFRHTLKEIESWMTEQGLGLILDAHSFYCATAPSMSIRKENLGG
jgi:hypothetical protein